MQRVREVNPRPAFIGGFLAVSLDPKNLALTLSATRSIEEAHRGVGQRSAALMTFVVLGTVAAPAVI